MGESRARSVLPASRVVLPAHHVQSPRDRVVGSDADGCSSDDRGVGDGLDVRTRRGGLGACRAARHRGRRWQCSSVRSNPSGANPVDGPDQLLRQATKDRRLPLGVPCGSARPLAQGLHVATRYGSESQSIGAGTGGGRALPRLVRSARTSIDEPRDG